MAVTSHGSVNLLRHNQLKDLFADRAAMREYSVTPPCHVSSLLASTPPTCGRRGSTALHVVNENKPAAVAEAVMLFCAHRISRAEPQPPAW